MATSTHRFLMADGQVLNEEGSSVAALKDTTSVTPERLVMGATRLGATHLWMMPEYALQPPTAIAPEFDILSHVNKHTGYLSSLTGRPRKPYNSPNVSVIFLSQSTWPKQETFAGLVGIITGIERKLGVPMKASPTSVGLRYLEKIDARYYKRYFENPDVDKGELRALAKTSALPLIWCRMPEPEELHRGYLVAVDKGSAYPRAAAEERMGIGTPVEQVGGVFDPKKPGLWDVVVNGLENVDKRLPAPLWPGWTFSVLATPVVKMLLKLGCDITVREALVWEQSAPVFDRWAHTLWEARKEIDAIKLVMNNTLGFTINGDDLEDEKYRPDWHAHIVGCLRALMMYNAISFAKKTGLYPIGCYIDALYYLSDTPTLPEITKQSDSLGGYKHKWTLPLTEEVKAIITSSEEQQHFNMMLNKLNTLAGEK